MVNLSVIATAVILASSASAHTIFQRFYVNGADQGQLTGIRAPDSNNPITDVNVQDIICNGISNPFHQPVSKTVIDVPAGGQVTAEWHHMLYSVPNDQDDPIAASHHGPIISYLAKVSDATQSDVSGLKWFKIHEDGYSNGVWGVDKMVANKGKVTFNIPSCIESGQYLLRHEIIALHSAYNYPGAQFYMECAQINVVGGSGSKTPSTYASFPGAYKGTDPGVKINIYDPLSNYTIPGPPLFTC
ncbi:glycoside hydrolase family 61 protein [Fomes fomentarius]|nr:glycoside hydrolase family 61 protein [Fomes fomentarius]